MKTSHKIFIILFVLVIGGIYALDFWFNQNKPEIKISSIDNVNKSAAFSMSYKGINFASTANLGGIKRQMIKGVLFEAVTVGDTIVFSIKGENGETLSQKKVSFG